MTVAEMGAIPGLPEFRESGGGGLPLFNFTSAHKNLWWMGRDLKNSTKGKKAEKERNKTLEREHSFFEVPLLEQPQLNSAPSLDVRLVTSNLFLPKLFGDILFILLIQSL